MDAIVLDEAVRQDDAQASVVPTPPASVRVTNGFEDIVRKIADDHSQDKQIIPPSAK